MVSQYTEALKLFIFNYLKYVQTEKNSYEQYMNIICEKFNPKANQ